LDLSANYSFIELDLNDDVFGVKTPVTSNTHTPNHMFNVRSHIELPYNTNWTTTLHYVDDIAIPVNPVAYRNISDYLRLDSKIEWRVTDDIDVSLIGQNLFDEYHPEYDNFLFSVDTEVGRSVFGKVSIDF